MERGVSVIASMVALAACAAPSPPGSGALPPPARSASPPHIASSTPVHLSVPEAQVVDASPVESAPAPASEGTVLVIGDSHALGPFGRRLATLLNRSGRFVVTEGACGATTETFVKVPDVACGYEVAEWPRDGAPRALIRETGPAKTHTLDTMMTTFAPSVVVVVLGTNYPRAPVAESADEFMKRLCRDKPCPRVLWIGPPSFGGLASGYISKSIKSALARYDRATFIDSTTFNEKTPLPLRTPHFRDEQARGWAEYAFERIAPALADGGAPVRDR